MTYGEKVLKEMLAELETNPEKCIKEYEACCKRHNRIERKLKEQYFIYKYKSIKAQEQGKKKKSGHYSYMAEMCLIRLPILERDILFEQDCSTSEKAKATGKEIINKLRGRI